MFVRLTRANVILRGVQAKVGQIAPEDFLNADQMESMTRRDLIEMISVEKAEKLIASDPSLIIPGSIEAPAEIPMVDDEPEEYKRTPAEILVDATVHELEASLAKVDDLDLLDLVAQAEIEGKNRAGAFAAIDDRISELT